MWAGVGGIIYGGGPHPPLASRDQCDLMARLCLIFWPFTTMKIFPIAKRIAKVGSKDCQILTKAS